MGHRVPLDTKKVVQLISCDFLGLSYTRDQWHGMKNFRELPRFFLTRIVTASNLCAESSPMDCVGLYLDPLEQANDTERTPRKIQHISF